MPFSGGSWIAAVGGVAGGPGFIQFAPQFRIDRAVMPGTPLPGMPGTAVLVIETITSYDAWPQAAPVFINNQQIGIVDPHAYPQYEEYHVLSLPFASTAFAGPTSINVLRITPITPQDYVLVGSWRIHYHQLLP
jgi:hypothetical protein